MSSQTKRITSTSTSHARTRTQVPKASIATMNIPPDRALTMEELQDLLQQNKVLERVTDTSAGAPRGFSESTMWFLLKATFKTLVATNEKLLSAAPENTDQNSDKNAEFEDKMQLFEEKMMQTVQATIQKAVSEELAKQVKTPPATPAPAPPPLNHQGQTVFSPWSDIVQKNIKTTARLTLSGDQEAIVASNSLLAKTRTTYRKKNADGSVQYGFTSAAEMASIASKIEAKSNENVKKYVHTPKVTLRNVDVSFIGRQLSDRDSTDSLILNSIRELNPDVDELIKSGSEMSVVYFNRHVHNPDEATVGLKVTDNLNSLLLSKGHVHIGHSCSRVEERIFIRQCYKCQSFGHLISECKASNPACFRCAGAHFGRDCTSRTRFSMKCANCAKSSNPLIQSGATGHNAASFSCPLLQQYRSKN